MNIVIPTDTDEGLTALRGAHFGRASYYTVVTVEKAKVVSTKSIRNMGHEQGGCSVAVNNIKNLGADVLIVSGIGASPLSKFQQENIAVYRDSSSKSVEECITNYFSSSSLEMNASDACNR